MSFLKTRFKYAGAEPHVPPVQTIKGEYFYLYYLLAALVCVHGFVGESGRETLAFRQDPVYKWVMGSLEI